MADPHADLPPRSGRLPFDIWWAIGGALTAAIALMSLRLLGFL